MNDILRLDDVGCDVYDLTIAAGEFREIPTSADYIGCLDATQDGFSLSVNGSQYFYFQKGLTLVPPETVIRPRVRNDGTDPLVVKMIIGRGQFTDSRLNIVGGSALPCIHQCDEWIKRGGNAGSSFGTMNPGDAENFILAPVLFDRWITGLSFAIDVPSSGNTNIMPHAWIGDPLNAQGRSAVAGCETGTTFSAMRPHLVMAGEAAGIATDGTVQGRWLVSTVGEP